MQPIACPETNDFTTPNQPLDNLAAALKAGGPIDILAIGSASTVAHGKAGFPYQMVDALQAGLPKATFRLTVKGNRGLTAADMYEELRTGLARERYRLVLWQTGTVEAVRGTRPDDLREVLEEGADLVAAQGGNLILIDPQFSRFLRANTDLEPYKQAMETAAEVPGADLFRRFELMHSWAQDGALDLERTAPKEQETAVRTLNACLGEALAKFVLNGVGG
ncbi:MAG: hypothetical protein ACREF3_08640 [Acetobacteraceae bacterium]